MSISKFGAGIAFAGFALMVSGTAFAGSDIKNADDCAFEGGSMTNVKGSDYCLVQIRPEAYRGAEYDGNQLGVVDCPGSKLNDGLFCMYPVTPSTSASGYVKIGDIKGETEATTPATPTNTNTMSILNKAGSIVSGGTNTGGSMKDKAAMGLLKNKVLGGNKSTTDILVDVAKDEAKQKAEDEAKKAAAKLLGGN